MKRQIIVEPGLFIAIFHAKYDSDCTYQWYIAEQPGVKEESYGEILAMAK